METKKIFRIFTIFEHEKEQNYLRSMHKSGWKFVKLNKLCVYTFEKCAPEDVIYQLDYNNTAIKDKSEYLQMFSDCGWEYLQDYSGYTYFRKSAKNMKNGDEEIFCDASSRLQMFERVFKGRIVPLMVLFACVIIPQLIMCIINGRTLGIAFFAAVAAVYIAAFTAYAIKYIKYKKQL